MDEADELHIPLSKLRVSEFNARRAQGESLEAIRQRFHIRKLADDLRARGQLHNINVFPPDADGIHDIIGGQRRFLAFALLAEEEPGNPKWKVIRARIRDVGKKEAFFDSLAENDERLDLDPFERAERYREAMQNFGLTQRELAKEVGKSEAQVSETIAVLRLTARVRAMVENGELGRPHASDLAQAFADPEEQEAAATLLVGLNFQEARHMLRILRENRAWFSLPREELRARALQAANGVPQDVRKEIEDLARKLGFRGAVLNWTKMTPADAQRIRDLYRDMLARRQPEPQPVRVAVRRAVPTPAGAHLLEDIVPGDAYGPGVREASAEEVRLYLEPPSPDAQRLMDLLKECRVHMRVRDPKDRRRVREVDVALHEVLPDAPQHIAFLADIAPEVLRRLDAGVEAA